ncbi:MAG: hypothetical protein FWE47_02865, partial [Oscillospiraceae bacterium]|nr:hypothetical protein [Oscillospiraceae bacterium]
MRYIKIASFWIFSLALAYLATLPYMNSFAIGGDDACKHAPNIMALADEIKAGRFPFGVMSSSRMGNGLITPLLYPCMFSSIASWLIAFGVNSVLATKIFIFLLNFATILITFWSARKITKSTGASWVIAILYTFAVYRIGDIYFRFALGEFVVMTFLPLVLYSIYNIFYEEKIKIWLFPLAFFCVVNSHLITTTFVFMFFMVLLLANIHKIVWIKERKFFINKKIFFDLLKIAGLTILLSIGFLLPMLEQRYGRLVLPGPWNMIDNHYDLKRVFSNDLSRSIGTWGIGIAFGLLSLVIIPWKKVKNKHFFATCIIIAAASFLMTTKYVPWSQLDKDFFNKLFSYIQFPWRFHTIFILFASFICGIALKSTLDYIKWNNVKAVLYGIIIAALVVNAHSFISKIDVRKHFY